MGRVDDRCRSSRQDRPGCLACAASVRSLRRWTEGASGLAKGSSSLRGTSRAFKSNTRFARGGVSPRHLRFRRSIRRLVALPDITVIPSGVSAQLEEDASFTKRV
jgi:hypothetical protein